jgi:hypothetical protein
MNVFVFAILASMAAGPSSAWRGDLFARAIKNDSTTSDYVLVTILDAKGHEQAICTKAPLLLGAIHREYAIGYDRAGVERARAIALSNTDGRFVLRRRAARRNVQPFYNSTELTEARGLLRGLSADAIVSGLEDDGSLRPWLHLSPQDRPIAHEAALAHALLELGFLPSSGCHGGLLLTV